MTGLKLHRDGYWYRPKDAGRKNRKAKAARISTHHVFRQSAVFRVVR